MNDFEGIIKFMQSPLGRMLFNAGKDVVTNHVIPYVRNNTMRPPKMSEEEVAARAQEEFQTVNDFDLQHDPEQKQETKKDK